VAHGHCARALLLTIESEGLMPLEQWLLPFIGYIVATAALIFFCWKWAQLLCAPYC